MDYQSRRIIFGSALFKTSYRRSFLWTDNPSCACLYELRDVQCITRRTTRARPSSSQTDFGFLV